MNPRTPIKVSTEDFTKLAAAFSKLYLEAVNGVVCDPYGEAGTRNCCITCYKAWQQGKEVLDKYDPRWGSMGKAFELES